MLVLKLHFREKITKVLSEEAWVECYGGGGGVFGTVAWGELNKQGGFFPIFFESQKRQKRRGVG